MWNKQICSPRSWTKGGKSLGLLASKAMQNSLRATGYNVDCQRQEAQKKEATNPLGRLVEAKEIDGTSIIRSSACQLCVTAIAWVSGAEAIEKLVLA